MTNRLKYLPYLLLALAISILCLTGYQQLQAIFVTRPSEKMPA
jgi:hypothetical protein